MSKSPEGAEAAPEYTLEEFMEGFRKQVGLTVKEKKKEDKLSDTLDDLKKAGTEVVEGFLKDQPTEQPLDPEKFLQGFWKAFEARLKQIPDVRKQLKSKGIPDLKATMGSIIHMTFYDHAVLPGLTKKERPPNDKLVSIFAEKFDRELDAVVKKKEYKMYKDAAAEVAGAAIQKSFADSIEVQEKERELAQLKKLPRASRNEKQLMDENAELKDKNQELQGSINHLEGQMAKMNDPDTEAAAWEYKYNTVYERSLYESNLIGELEVERNKLQEQLKEANEKANKLEKGRGSAQGEMKGLETQLQNQKEALANAKIELGQAKKHSEYLKEKMEDAESARTQANIDCEKISIDFDNFKNKVRNSGSGSKDAESQATIKTLREQAEKDKAKISQLEAAQTKMLSQMEDDLSQADKKAEEAVKTKLRNLAQDLASAREETEKLADTEAERDRYELACKDLRESQKSLQTITEEQKKRLKESEADKARAGDAGKELQGLRKERDDLRAANQKLDTALKEQQKLAAAKTGNGGDEKALKTLQDQNKKLEDENEKLRYTKGDMEERVSNLTGELDEFSAEAKYLKAELKKAQGDASPEQIQALQGQIKELQVLNNNLQETLNKVARGGNGTGLKTLTEVPHEEEMTEKTPEEKAEVWQKQWAAAEAARNGLATELGDLRRGYQVLEAAYEWAEKGREDAQTNAIALEDSVEAARSSMVAAEPEAKEAKDAVEAAETRIQAAEAARQAAEAAREAAEAAAAAAGNATTTATTGPARTIGEVALPQRMTNAVPGVVRDSTFAGLTNIFGRDARDPIGRGGGGPGRRPSATLATDNWADWSLASAFIVMTVMIILALLTMGAEGHKAAIWIAANHETRAQYANDWYYFTIPIPQLEYIYYIFTRAAWGKM